MEKNTFKSFDRMLSWNTKFFVLLTFVLLLFALFTKSDFLGMQIGALISLIVVLIVDYYQIVSKKYPVLWNRIKFIIVATILILAIIGFIRVST